MPDQTDPQSPLNTIPSAHQPALTMRERPFMGYLNLRGQPEQVAFTEAVRSIIGIEPPVVPNTVSRANAVSVAWLAPNEWLLVTAPDAQADMQASLRQAFGNLFAAITDVSSGYTTVEIKGREARDLLARGCSVDLHPSVFGPDRCAQTLLAKADVAIVQVDQSPTFHVIVRRSFADYLWRWLDDAARNMGASVQA